MAAEVKNAELMRQGFKRMNKYLMIPMWQLGLGKLLNIWPKGMGRFLVLVHRGRKSGKIYHTPINYTPVGDEIAVMAGFGEKTDWYRNLMAAGEGEVWLPDGWWRVTIADATDSPDFGLCRQLLLDTGFAARLFEGIQPQRMTDEEIKQYTERWRLLRLRKVQPCTGPGGPGEYAWLWPLTTLLLLVLRPLRRK